MVVLSDQAGAMKRVDPIYLDDIITYGKQLLAFVITYRDHVYIKTDEDVKRLNELEAYAIQLVNHQYDRLISNASELIQFGFTPCLNTHNPPWE